MLNYSEIPFFRLPDLILAAKSRIRCKNPPKSNIFRFGSRPLQMDLVNSYNRDTVSNTNIVLRTFS